MINASSLYGLGLESWSLNSLLQSNGLSPGTSGVILLLLSYGLSHSTSSKETQHLKIWKVATAMKVKRERTKPKK